MLEIWADKISTLDVSFTRRLRRFVLERIELLAPSSPNWLSGLALKFIKFCSFYGNRESKYLNLIFTRLLPANPLQIGRKYLPTVLICAPKDLEVLPLSLVSAVENLSGSEKLWILSPESMISDVRKLLNSLKIEAEIIIDEDLIAEFFGHSQVIIQKAARMQLLKLLAVISLPCDEILVADGDTLYMKPRNWLMSNKVVYPVSQEYLVRHKNFNRGRLRLSSTSGLGFVTHHQVVFKESVQEIVLRAGGVVALAQIMQSVYANTENWHREYPSEWQFLGDFLYKHTEYELVPARFANLAISRNVLAVDFCSISTSTEGRSELNRIAKSVPEAYSISLHAYK